MDRTLVVILAETRAFEFTFDGFKKNLLEVFDADLALCVGDGPNEDTTNPFYLHAKYVWTYNEKEDWAISLDEMAAKRGGGKDWRLLLHHKGILFGGVKGIGGQLGSGAIGLFFRAFLKECLSEGRLTDKYDRFIITRSDFVYDVPHVPPGLLDNEFIWVPDGEGYGGITDRHFICPGDFILEYLSVVDEIFTSPEKLYSKMSFYEEDIEWNIEKFLKFAMVDRGLFDRVQFFPYTMYCVRGPEGRTRWAGGRYDKRKNLYIKYKEEYRRSMYAQKLLGSSRKWSEAAITRHAEMLRRSDNLRLLRKKSKRVVKRVLLVLALLLAYYLGTLAD